MTEKQLKYLFDIQLAIKEINDFRNQSGDGFQVFSSDIMYRKAVERNLEIIGEAVNRLLKSGFLKPISHSRSIVALRNKISHEYDSVSNENLWGIIVRHLPLLEVEIGQLISENEIGF